MKNISRRKVQETVEYLRSWAEKTQLEPKDLCREIIAACADSVEQRLLTDGAK